MNKNGESFLIFQELFGLLFFVSKKQKIKVGKKTIENNEFSAYLSFQSV